MTEQPCSTRPIVGWLVEGASEGMHVMDYGEAIEVCLDNYFAPIGEPREKPITLPKTLRVVPYHRPALDLKRWGVLKGLIEELDEEYAGDNYNDRCTPAMEEAERTFLRVVFAEYECELLDAGVPTDCDVAMWVREHFPEWLDSGRVRIGPDS